MVGHLNGETVENRIERIKAAPFSCFKLRFDILPIGFGPFHLICPEMAVACCYYCYYVVSMSNVRVALFYLFFFFLGCFV